MKKSFCMPKHFLSLFILGFVLTGCEFFNVGVKDFLEKYTETAGVMEYELDGIYPTDSSGVVCIDSETDHTIKLNLRNPKGLDLYVVYEFDVPEMNPWNGNPEGLTLGTAGNYTLGTSGSFFRSYSIQRDNTQYEINFNAALLSAIENATLEDKENQSISNPTKNISGRIRIINMVTGVEFDSFPITLSANTKPLDVEQLVLNKTTDVQNKYVLCFFMPVMSNSTNKIHYLDTHKILINCEGVEKTYYFNYSGSNYTFYDKPINDDSKQQVENFKTSCDTDVLSENSLQQKFSSLQTPSGYVPCYYVTDNILKDTESRFSVKIVDDAGLYSEATISNRAQKLNPVVIKDLNGNEISSAGNLDDTILAADENSNTAKIILDHDLKTTADDSCSSVIIDYKVYEFNNGNYVLKKSGSLTKTAGSTPSIELPPHKGYKIEAYARKDYYLKSELTEKNNIKISRSPNFYISQNGNDDENDGTKARPYGSIRKCVDEIIKQVDDYGIDSNGYNIYLLTNLTVDENEIFDVAYGYYHNSYAWFETSSAISTKASGSNPFKLTISGFGGNKTIDFNRSNENRLGKGFYFGGNPYSEYILKDLTLTGACDTQKAAVMFDAGDITTCQLSLINTTITKNMIIEDDEQLTYKGAGLYYAGSGKVNLSGAVKIFGNTTKLSSGKEYESNFHIDADSSPAQNTINITGSLKGSDIHVSLATQPDNTRPSIPFTIGYGYNSGFNNGVNPEEYFKGDSHYIGVNESGEACVEIDHGTVAGYEINEIKFISLPSETFTSVSKPKLVVKKAADGSGDPIPDKDFDSINIRIMDNVTLVKEIKNSLTLDLSNCIFEESERTYKVYVDIIYYGQGYTEVLNLTVKK